MIIIIRALSHVRILKKRGQRIQKKEAKEANQKKREKEKRKNKMREKERRDDAIISFSTLVLQK